MKIVFTKHVEDKLLEQDSLALNITKKRIVNVLSFPIIVDEETFPYQSVGILNKKLSLNIHWKIENESIKVITYYPASKGRYEAKIASKYKKLR